MPIGIGLHHGHLLAARSGSAQNGEVVRERLKIDTGLGAGHSPMVIGRLAALLPLAGAISGTAGPTHCPAIR